MADWYYVRRIRPDYHEVVDIVAETPVASFRTAEEAVEDARDRSRRKDHPTSDPAAEIAELRAEVERLRGANGTRPDYDLHCQQCGRAHILDTTLPNEVWNRIASPDELLCMVCIDARLAAAGLTAEAEFHYAGTALVSKRYTAEARVKVLAEALRSAERHLEEDVKNPVTHPIHFCPVLDAVRRALNGED